MMLGRKSANAYSGPSLPMYTSTVRASAPARPPISERPLTRDPGLPVEQALPDVAHPEPLARGAELVVLLQAADDDRALRLGEELGGVREVLDDEEGRRARDDGDEPLEDEDPCPVRSETCGRREGV